MMRLGTLLLFLMLLLPGSAAGTPATAEETAVLDSPALEAIFSEIVLADAPWPREKLRIENFTARPATLSLPKGMVTCRPVNQPHGKYLGGKALAVAILVDGREVETVKMTGDLQLYDEVLCTTRQLARHQILTEADFKTVRLNITMLGSDLVRHPPTASGKRLTTSLRAGAVIHASQLEEPPLVRRGDLVTIIASTDRLRVTAPGEARNDGARGDLVRIKNLMSRRELFAKVVADGMVQVDF